MTGGREGELKSRWKMTAMPKWVAQISWGRQRREKDILIWNGKSEKIVAAIMVLDKQIINSFRGEGPLI